MAAGTTGYAPDSEEAFDRLLTVNFKAQIQMSKHAAPQMPRGGAIVNIGSVFGGVDPKPDDHSITKRAVSLAGTPVLATRFASAVAFLARDDARRITRQDLIVDGGYSLISVFDLGKGQRKAVASVWTRYFGSPASPALVSPAY